MAEAMLELVRSIPYIVIGMLIVGVAYIYGWSAGEGHGKTILLNEFKRGYKIMTGDGVIMFIKTEKEGKENG